MTEFTEDEVNNFYIALEEGDTETISEYINKGFISDQDEGVILTPSEKGYLDIVRLLLLDPKVNPSDENNEAIIMASKEGYLEIVQLLLQDSREAVKQNVANMLDEISDVFPYPIDSSLYQMKKNELRYLYEFIGYRVRQSGDDFHVPSLVTLRKSYSKGIIYGIQFFLNYLKQNNLSNEQIGMLIHNYFDYLREFKEKGKPLSQFINFIIEQES